MTAISEEWREKHVVPHIMITLAGLCAEARARRPDRHGFRRQMEWHALIAIHEAAHTVVAVAVGHHQNGAAVEKTEHSYRGIAEHSPVTLPDGSPDHPTFEHFDKLLPDLRKATAFAQLAIGPVGWLRYLRTQWLRTDAILERHWLAVKMLASELRATGTVRRNRAQDLLDRWMPLRGTSILEALGYPQATCQYVKSTAENPQRILKVTVRGAGWEPGPLRYDPAPKTARGGPVRQPPASLVVAGGREPLRRSSAGRAAFGTAQPGELRA